MPREKLGPLLLGCLCCSPVIKWAFGRLRRKTASRGREDTRVWYRETMFSQMVSYDFLLHEPLHGYFLHLVCAPPEKPTKRCEPEEGCLRCSKRFDHGSHSVIVLLFEFKSVEFDRTTSQVKFSFFLVVLFLIAV